MRIPDLLAPTDALTLLKELPKSIAANSNRRAEIKAVSRLISASVELGERIYLPGKTRRLRPDAKPADIAQLKEMSREIYRRAKALGY
ncbi:hypothetical protein FHR81_002034 [Actinoalloteichus hoggarensis]|uniref:Uncharacterized protein n=1 Tax=Actinoalloteichus hoggarensis TaxID=1470176 RepID=A0A221W5B6_9PSEU|nr:hypothetical protein [Actinoalloteichus hoggarensis]ASO21065.1 hypothetical protein AHOG_17200 [Actinoalloteichus hoggarensis]MBB5920996.1 hypothetical protein [Actinoalloteichus hoggarensis]